MFFNTYTEWKHSPCLMRPITILFLLMLLLLGIIYFIVTIPQVLIGAVLGIVMKRGNLIIEFLYPLSIGKHIHLLLLKMGLKKRSAFNSLHSRTIDYRIELCDGVYIHCIPQLVDNICYLIVYDDDSTSKTMELRAFVVDVGDAKELKRQLERISLSHYSKRKIKIEGVLSTHKHHDHTAGNAVMHASSIPIFGAVIENVPYCTDFLKDGDCVKLPRQMEHLGITLEAIAAPSHTRGSLVYSLTCRMNDVCFLFSGDALFSAGGGVPFEADHETHGPADKKKRGDYISPAAGMNSMERVFCEILLRSTPSKKPRQTLVFPGHEYTFDLLQRQFDPKSLFMQDFTVNVNLNKVGTYSTFAPNVFFNMVSQFYIAAHRRTLPRSGGRMLTIPSTIQRELDINPHFRSLIKRGHCILTAVRLYRRYLWTHQKDVFNPSSSFTSQNSCMSQPENSLSYLASDSFWTLNSKDIHKNVFTTVYTQDLQSIIKALQTEKITKDQAADALSNLSKQLDKPSLEKRPIPNTLLSDKSIYMGCLSLAILASPPTAMTFHDAKCMNLPIPLSRRDSDKTIISRSRLLHALRCLGVLEHSNAQDVESIYYLWYDAHVLKSRKNVSLKKSYDSIDAKSDLNVSNAPDGIPLGYLKTILYGLSNDELRRSHGELVRHHPAHCRLCKGCQIYDTGVEIVEEKIDEAKCKEIPLFRGNLEELELEVTLSDVEKVYTLKRCSDSFSTTES